MINENFKAGVMENYQPKKTIKSCPDHPINKNSWQLKVDENDKNS